MEDDKAHLLKKLIDAVNEISSITDYRCCRVNRQICNLARRLKLLTPMLEEIRDSKEPLSDDGLKSLTIFADALESTKDFLRFGRHGSKIYVPSFLPMGDWVRESIEKGIASVMKQLLSLQPPSEVTFDRVEIWQEVETLQAMATINNIDLSPFVSQVQKLLNAPEVPILGNVELPNRDRLNELTAELFECRATLRLILFSNDEKEATLSALEEEVRKQEADLVARKASLETERAALNNAIQQQKSRVQQVQGELDRVCLARVHRWTAKKVDP